MERLAAAQYAVAVQLGRPSVYPEALSAADRALRIDGRLAEALFNRALILERLGLSGEARAAWQRYLEVDGASHWAEEARTRLSRLSESTGESQFKRQLPLLEQAAVTATRHGLMHWSPHTRNRRGRMRKRSTSVSGANSGEARSLTVARHRRGPGADQNQQLLRDAVASIDRASDRRLLAEAHALYRRGRIAYSRGQLGAAEPDLRGAAELFARVESDGAGGALLRGQRALRPQ